MICKIVEDSNSAFKMETGEEINYALCKSQICSITYLKCYIHDLNKESLKQAKL